MLRWWVWRWRLGREVGKHLGISPPSASFFTLHEVRELSEREESTPSGRRLRR
jgi:hypothetical protein